jgi:NADPH:quinone reductase-like Zn-dependent oxidoreductase
MKMVRYTQRGEPAQVLELVETSARAPGPGQARVEVLSAPIHNADLLQVMGLYGRSAELPATPGGEAIGRVVELGEGVTHLAVGATVFITTGSTWAQQVTVPAAGLIPMPEGDLDQLAMLVSSPATAHLLLEGYGDLQEGDWLIQSAANSAVGSAVVQLAKARGLRTLNIVRRPEVVAGLQELGADVVLVGTDDLVARVQEATGGAGVRLAFDAIGGEVFSKLVDVLAMGGVLVSYSQVELGAAAVTPGDLIFRQITVTGFWLSQWFTDATPADKQALFGQLVPLVASGQLRMAIDSTYTLDQLTEAVTRSMGGRRNGKVLFHPNG